MILSIIFISPSKLRDLTELINQIVKVISYIALPIAVVMIIVSALIFLTGGGDPNKIAQAKRLLLYALVGLAIVLFALGIASLIDFALS